VATGVPRKTKRKTVTRNGAHIEISYPGKRTAAEILSMPPEMFEVATSSKKSGQRNRLYFGENLAVLAHLNQDTAISGKVRLIYIDPPYATQTVFHSRELAHAYEDVFELGEYMEFMRERLILLHSILANDGTIYVHLDAKMVFHIKVIMDEIFGVGNFRNCITRRKSNPKNYTRKQFGNVSDYILMYSKTDTNVWNRQVEQWTEGRAREYQYVEPSTGRKFMKVPVHAPGVRNGATGGMWRGMLPPPGKHWQYTPERLDEMEARGEIFWSKNGNPRRKVYLDTNPGVPVQDIWMDYIDAHNQNISITGYPTEKPFELLKRIVEASSNPGDIVLDCFAGSGTTLAAADMLERRWIGVDNAPEALRTILHRFQHGTQRMGDFVSKRKSNAKAPTLFDEEPEPLAKARSVIKDFTCFVQPSLRKMFQKQEV
jgi:adenine-specific DNA-methyltransferase